MPAKEKIVAPYCYELPEELMPGTPPPPLRSWSPPPMPAYVDGNDFKKVTEELSKKVKAYEDLQKNHAESLKNFEKAEAKKAKAREEWAKEVDKYVKWIDDISRKFATWATTTKGYTLKARSTSSRRRSTRSGLTKKEEGILDMFDTWESAMGPDKSKSDSQLQSSESRYGWSPGLPPEDSPEWTRFAEEYKPRAMPTDWPTMGRGRMGRMGGYGYGGYGYAGSAGLGGHPWRLQIETDLTNNNAYQIQWPYVTRALVQALAKAFEVSPDVVRAKLTVIGLMEKPGP